MNRAQSWHIPKVPKYTGGSVPNDALYVVFLSRLSDDERTQICQSLEVVDEEWADRLPVARPRLRPLAQKKWIRDTPVFSSEVVLKIAEAAYENHSPNLLCHSSLIFVDSGWEAGNVIAAHWHKSGDDAEPRLESARVPMNIARTLLSACDEDEAHSLAQVLGEDAYEESKVDFYKDATRSKSDDEKEDAIPKYQWPDFLPKDLALTRSQPVVISLRPLNEGDIAQLLDRIVNGDEGGKHFKNVRIYNWSGPGASRIDLYHIFLQLHENSPEKDQNMCAFFIDYLLQDEQGEPQIVAATKLGHDRPRVDHAEGVQIIPLETESFLPYWRQALAGKKVSKSEDLGDIWARENLYDIRGVTNFARLQGMPIFYLQPFTIEEERKIHAAFSSLSDIEESEDWGSEFAFLGYPWPDDDQAHTIEELRDLFESCDPLSPKYDPKKPGPYKFEDYPHHFAAVDSRVLKRRKNPEVTLVSSLDFSGEDTYTELGWFYGTVEAKEAHINFVNLEIANMGPMEMFEDGQKLWLSDLTEYTEQDWPIESGV